MLNVLSQSFNMMVVGTMTALGIFFIGHGVVAFASSPTNKSMTLAEDTQQKDWSSATMGILLGVTLIVAALIGVRPDLFSF